MATVSEEYTIEDQRCVVRFMWAKGLSAKDTHKGIISVYGGKCSSPKAVHNWVKKFSQELLKVADDARPG
jgi:hypothetical protein